MNPAELPRRALRRAKRGVNRAIALRQPPVPLDAPSAQMPVVFVGGTGRSGTTITGRLIAAHPRKALIKVETKFISAPGGLCDLAVGATDLTVFEQRILGHWFRPRLEGGLFKILDEEAIRAGLSRLRERVGSEPWLAAAEFAHALLDPIAAKAGADAWVEMDPGNVFRAEELLRMFPSMRLVHSVRDGRDVAASVTPLPWGPNDLDASLDWWARQLERAFAVSDRVPDNRVLVVQMEDLTLRDRNGQYGRLRNFLGLNDDPAMRTYFEEHVSEARSHVGRWRQEVPADRLARFEAHHERLAAELRARRRPYAPVEAAQALAVI